MRFGLLSDIGEITPNIFAKLDRLSRAKIFIALYNSGVESELKIPLSYAKFLNFKEIFEARINFLLREKCLNLKPKKMVKRRNLAQISLRTKFLHASFYLLFKSFKLSDPIASARMRSKKHAKLAS